MLSSWAYSSALLNFLNIHGSVKSEYSHFHCEHNLNSLSNTWKIKKSGGKMIKSPLSEDINSLVSCLFLFLCTGYNYNYVKMCIEDNYHITLVKLYCHLNFFKCSL